MSQDFTERIEAKAKEQSHLEVEHKQAKILLTRTREQIAKRERELVQLRDLEASTKEAVASAGNKLVQLGDSDDAEAAEALKAQGAKVFAYRTTVETLTASTNKETA